MYEALRRRGKLVLLTTALATGCFLAGFVTQTRISQPAQLLPSAGVEYNALPGPVNQVQALLTHSDSAADAGVAVGRRVLLEPDSSLPDEPSSAKGWVLDAGSSATVDQVRRFIIALGTRPVGEPECTEDVGCSAFIDGLSVVVHNDTLRTLNAYVPDRAPRPCDPGPRADRCRADYRSALPSVLQATAQAQRLMADLGAPVEDYVFNTYLDGEHTIKSIASLTLSGTRLPFRWTIDISTKGIYSVNGFLATPRPTDPYQLVGAATAALRTSDIRWADFGPIPDWSTMPARSEPGTVNSAQLRELIDLWSNPVQATPPSTDRQPGLLSRVTRIPVSEAVLSLALYRTENGSPLLLPAWSFTVADSSVRWTVPAVDDSYLVSK